MRQQQQQHPHPQQKRPQLEVEEGRKQQLLQQRQPLAPLPNHRHKQSRLPPQEQMLLLLMQVPKVMGLLSRVTLR